MRAAMVRAVPGLVTVALMRSPRLCGGGEGGREGRGGGEGDMCDES